MYECGGVNQTRDILNLFFVTAVLLLSVCVQIYISIYFTEVLLCVYVCLNSCGVYVQKIIGQ